MNYKKIKAHQLQVKDIVYDWSPFYNGTPYMKLQITDIDDYRPEHTDDISQILITFKFKTLKNTKQFDALTVFGNKEFLIEDKDGQN